MLSSEPSLPSRHSFSHADPNNTFPGSLRKSVPPNFHVFCSTFVIPPCSAKMIVILQLTNSCLNRRRDHLPSSTGLGSVEMDVETLTLGYPNNGREKEGKRLLPEMTMSRWHRIITL
jgi:hypothetical protein